MNQNSILVKNEIEANRFAAKVMLGTIGFVALVFLLDVLKIFVAPVNTMAIALSIATVFLALPAILVFVLHAEGSWVKYVTVSAAVLMITAISMFLAFHVVIMYIYAMAISSLYFSRKLSWFAVIFSVIATTFGQIMGLYSDGLADKNFTTLFEVSVYGAAPRAIQLLVISLIFIALSKRTRKMLSNVLGAEEQKNMLDKMLLMTNKSYEVSKVLSESVNQLSEITENTTKANENIAENTQRIASGSENTLQLIDQATDSVVDMSENLSKIAEEGRMIADISKQMTELTEKNSAIMKEAAEEMNAISGATEESKAIINSLGERSSEIRRIVEIISGISGQTNLLALNAAIESARAGEQGKGFAVVASQIRSLAEQSEKAAKDIANLIKEVLADTEKAVAAMDNGSGMVGKGMEIIENAGKSFEEVSTASKEMNDKVQNVSAVTLSVAKGSEKIVGIVKDIRDINHKSLEELQNIAAASEQQLASMQQVASSVSSIEKISDELLTVVKENK